MVTLALDEQGFVERIESTARGTAESAKEMMPDEMVHADAVLSLSAPVESKSVPFMPTSDSYWSEKAALDAMAPAVMMGAFEDKVLAAAAAGATLSAVPLAPPTLQVVSFPGANQTAADTFPPDTHGAVGRSHFVEVVNSRVVVFDKLGTQLKSTSLRAFFGTNEFVFDPRVVYDQTWNRWVIVATRASTAPTDNNRHYFLAVSTSGDPTGSYFVYQPTFGGGPFDAGDWFDYPQLGMDQDAVIITANVFDIPVGGFKFAAMYPIAKARIYNGLGFNVPVFTGLAGTLAPPIVLDQNNNAYLVAASNGRQLHLYRGENLSNAFEASLVLQALIDVPDYATPPSARQPGSNQVLDTLDGRFVNASTQVGDSLWNVHTIRLGSFPTPKFYQIDTEGAEANTIKQQGFFFESATSDDFNVSIAANALDEAFVTWNSTDAINRVSALQHQARVRISGRQPADPLGDIPAGSALFTSAVALTGNHDPNDPPNLQRWGDYSAVTLDPEASPTCPAGRRAWIVNETIVNANTWGSRVARIGFCN
jgi:hypothetical protein